MADNNINIYKSPEATEKLLKEKPESFWMERGEKMALKLFHDMAERVPAYKGFLKKNKVNPASIKTIADFKSVPALDKDNYLRKYPRNQLCWDGVFNDTSWVISATSGSTGEPFYFPRQKTQDLQYALTAELYLRSNFKIHERSTLYIDAFAMGVWIGGVFTYEAIKTIADTGKYNLSIITPGINKAEVIKAVKNLGKDFDQIIIGSYPPVLKDIIDEGTTSNLDWGEYNLGVVFSAEGFSETFRDYVLNKGGVKDELKGTLNHYGTVDLGTMSHETPFSIMMRRLAVNDKQLYEKLFGQIHKLPTLTQYVPEMFYFEEENGGLYCSASSGIPLVRYDLKDNGGVFGFDYVVNDFNGLGVDLLQMSNTSQIADTVWNLPFVYIYERSDFSVSFLGFEVYPETVRKALDNRLFEKFITTKFSMMAEYDKESKQTLQIHVELKNGGKESDDLKKKVTAEIIEVLKRENPIYRMNYGEFPERVAPIVTFWPYEHPVHFKAGGKQKWVKK